MFYVWFEEMHSINPVANRLTRDILHECYGSKIETLIAYMQLNF